MNNTQRRRFDAGLCVDCSQPRGDNGTLMRCRSCAKKASARSSASTTRSRAIRRAQGMCIYCDTPATGGIATCDDHTEKRRVAVALGYQKTLKPLQQERRANGVCVDCGRARYHASAWCREHWINDIARRYKVPVKNRAALIDQLEQGGFKCAYTGWDIVPGDTASLDHVASRSTDKDKISDIANLAWCHSEVNRMKGAIPIEDFIALCRLIVSRADANKSLKSVEGHRQRPVEAGSIRRAA